MAKNKDKNTPPKEKKVKKKVFTQDELKAKKKIPVVIQGKDIEKLVEAGLELKEQNTNRDIEDFVREKLGLDKRAKKSDSKKAELCAKLDVMVKFL